MRRLVPAVAVALLAAAGCSSSTAKPAAAPSPSLAVTTTVPAVASPLATSSPTQSPSPSSSPAAQSPSSTVSSQPAVAIPAGQLPDRPAAGAPALDDVSIIKSSSDPCGIPADDSGNEAQLIDAERVGPVLVVTFEVTNPCAAPLSYDITVTQAIGSATGPSGGPELRTTTAVIQPGKSAPFKVNVDPKATLTPAQLQQLWVGVTHIAKHSAG